jgi:hypothetical protein
LTAAMILLSTTRCWRWWRDRSMVAALLVTFAVAGSFAHGDAADHASAAAPSANHDGSERSPPAAAPDVAHKGNGERGDQVSAPRPDGGPRETAHPRDWGGGPKPGHVENGAVDAHPIDLRGGVPTRRPPAFTDRAHLIQAIHAPVRPWFPHAAMGDIVPAIAGPWRNAVGVVPSEAGSGANGGQGALRVAAHTPGESFVDREPTVLPSAIRGNVVVMGPRPIAAVNGTTMRRLGSGPAVISGARIANGINGSTVTRRY